MQYVIFWLAFVVVAQIYLMSVRFICVLTQSDDYSFSLLYTFPYDYSTICLSFFQRWTLGLLQYWVFTKIGYGHFCVHTFIACCISKVPYGLIFLFPRRPYLGISQWIQRWHILLCFVSLKMALFHFFVEVEFCQ